MKYVITYNIIVEDILGYSEKYWLSVNKEDNYCHIANGNIYLYRFTQLDSNILSSYLTLKDIKEIVPLFNPISENLFDGKQGSYKFDMTEEEMFYNSLKHSWWKEWIDFGHITESKI